MSATEIFRAAAAILACPDCRSTLDIGEGDVRCSGCRRVFTVSASGVLQLMPLVGRPEPPIYDDPDFKRYRALYDQDAESVYYSNQNALFHWIHHSAHQRTHEYWRQRPAQGWVADVGCGTGDHFGYFDDLSRVIGLDMSLGSLDVVRRRHPRAILIQADVNALPLRDASLDAAFSIYNLEHLYYLTDALREINRVLTGTGRFLVGLPTEGGLAWGLGRKLSTDRTYSKKYGIDYGKVMSIEHCNTADEVMTECRKVFTLRRRHYFPMWLPNVHPNLTISAEFQKR